MIHWSIDPVLIHLGPAQVRWYGLLFLAGFYLGHYYLQKVCRWEKKPPEAMDSLLIYAILGTTLGARFAHCIFYEWDYYSQHLLEIPMIWKGGLASHGGGAGVIIALWFFIKKHKEFSFAWLADRVAVPLTLSGALIRMGNLMNSEIIGKPTDGSWGFIFERIDQIPRHPTQIYEAIWYVMIWAGGLFWYNRFKRNPPTGFLFGWTLAGIFTGRIIIEFWKENQEAFEANMAFNMGQLLSLPYLIIGVGLMWAATRRVRQP
jgi:prolipoprotein diacylglyceryl transferase